jgi:hypothetical protein
MYLPLLTNNLQLPQTRHLLQNIHIKMHKISRVPDFQYHPLNALQFRRAYLFQDPLCKLDRVVFERYIRVSERQVGTENALLDGGFMARLSADVESNRWRYVAGE